MLGPSPCRSWVGVGQPWQKLPRTEGKKPASAFTQEIFAGLAFHALGPAVASGRICDIAVDPHNPKRYFLAVCSGGV
ncbi:MAG: hypothetical protein ACUVRQ_05015 [Thermoanaerobaculaceae bacterium]